MEEVEIGTGPRGLRRTERDEEEARELRLGAGVATGGRERTRGGRRACSRRGRGRPGRGRQAGSHHAEMGRAVM